MTVIAWDRTMLAWDSRATKEDRMYTVKKCRLLKDGRTIVVAGFLEHLPMAAKLLDGNGYPDMPPEIADFSDIIVWDKGKVFAYDDSREVRRVRGPSAWGTGQEYAMGALTCNTDAYTACWAAIKNCSSCGGRIHSLKRP